MGGLLLVLAELAARIILKLMERWNLTPGQARMRRAHGRLIATRRSR